MCFWIGWNCRCDKLQKEQHITQAKVFWSGWHKEFSPTNTCVSVVIWLPVEHKPSQHHNDTNPSFFVLKATALSTWAKRASRSSKTERWFDPCISHIEEFISRQPCSILQGHNLKLHHRSFRLNWRKAAFAVRIVGPWNRLPAFVVEAPSAYVFKSRLDVRWIDMLLGVTYYSATPLSPHLTLEWFFRWLSRSRQIKIELNSKRTMNWHFPTYRYSCRGSFLIILRSRWSGINVQSMQSTSRSNSEGLERTSLWPSQFDIAWKRISSSSTSKSSSERSSAKLSTSIARMSSGCSMAQRKLSISHRRHFRRTSANSPPREISHASVIDVSLILEKH